MRLDPGRTFLWLACLGLATLALLLLHPRTSSTAALQTLAIDQHREEGKSDVVEMEVASLAGMEHAEERVLEVAAVGNRSRVEPPEVSLEVAALAEEFRGRRELVARVCREEAGDLAARYSARWPGLSWEQALAKADVLEKRDRGMLWCKVPKAGSESWTSLFIKQWFPRKARQLMWRQQVGA